jgi:adenylate kinase
MIIFITGTPGTGKTTVSNLLKKQLPCRLVDINQLVEDENLYTGLDEERGYKIVDINSLCTFLQDVILLKEPHVNDPHIVVEGHLSHLCPGADVVIVLRTNPHILEDRLKAKGFKESKIRENLEAEALDMCTYEAYQKYKDQTQEIDTTSKSPQEIVATILEVINGEKSYPVGGIDFSEYLLE